MEPDAERGGVPDPHGDAVARVGGFIASLDAEVRSPAPGQWGLTLDSAGFPLDIGILIKGELLRVQTAVLPAAVIDPHQLLYWNRQAPFVCFGENQAGEVFVTGELPLAQLSAEIIDRFLGLVLASATRAREFAITHVWSVPDRDAGQ